MQIKEMYWCKSEKGETKCIIYNTLNGNHFSTFPWVDK